MYFLLSLINDELTENSYCMSTSCNLVNIFIFFLFFYFYFTCLRDFFVKYVEKILETRKILLLVILYSKSCDKNICKVTGWKECKSRFYHLDETEIIMVFCINTFYVTGLFLYISPENIKELVALYGLNVLKTTLKDCNW